MPRLCPPQPRMPHPIIRTRTRTPPPCTPTQPPPPLRPAVWGAWGAPTLWASPSPWSPPCQKRWALPVVGCGAGVRSTCQLSWLTLPAVREHAACSSSTTALLSQRCEQCPAVMAGLLLPHAAHPTFLSQGAPPACLPACLPAGVVLHHQGQQTLAEARLPEHKNERGGRAHHLVRRGAAAAGAGQRSARSQACLAERSMGMARLASWRDEAQVV